MNNEDYKKLLNSIPGDVVTVEGVSYSVLEHSFGYDSIQCDYCVLHRPPDNKYPEGSCAAIFDHNNVWDTTRNPLPCTDIRYYIPNSGYSESYKDFIRVDDQLGE